MSGDPLLIHIDKDPGVKSLAKFIGKRAPRDYHDAVSNREIGDSFSSELPDRLKGRGVCRRPQERLRCLQRDRTGPWGQDPGDLRDSPERGLCRRLP